MRKTKEGGNCHGKNQMPEHSVQEHGRTVDRRKDKDNVESESPASVHADKPKADREADIHVPEVWESIYT